MDYLERSKSWIEARTANNCKRMQKAAAELDFETAIEMREKLAELKKKYRE